MAADSELLLSRSPLLEENVQSVTTKPATLTNNGHVLNIEHSLTNSSLSSNSLSTLTSLMEQENRSTQQAYLATAAHLAGSSSFLTSDVDSDNSSILSASSPRPQSELIASAEHSAAFETDRFGFIIVPGSSNIEESMGSNSSERLKRKQMEKDRKEANRAEKWRRMLDEALEKVPISIWPTTHKKFLERLTKGIPDCLRAKVWQMLSVSHSRLPSDFGSKAFERLYLRISGFERQIDLDIERTLRDHVQFKPRFGTAQVSLFKVLVAYSNLDSEVGYCQGMSGVAAFLLLYYPEEEAFKLLESILGIEGTRQLYVTGFPKLFETFHIQERLMRKYMPALFMRLEQFGINSSIYATKWYLTLFLGFPYSLAVRIWDLFLFYGFDMLIVAALALLKYFERRLLRLEYEPCMQFLSHLAEQKIDESRFIKLVMHIWRKITDNCEKAAGMGSEGRGRFAKFREEHKRLREEAAVAKEEETAAKEMALQVFASRADVIL